MRKKIYKYPKLRRIFFIFPGIWLNTVLMTGTLLLLKKTTDRTSGPGSSKASYVAGSPGWMPGYNLQCPSIVISKCLGRSYPKTVRKLKYRFNDQSSVSGKTPETEN